MTSMYFSGKNINEIFYDDPDNQRIHIYPSLFIELMSDREQNARVFLDTPLLKIRSLDQPKLLPAPEHIINKFSASVSIGSTPDLAALYYITNLMVAAGFRDISSDEFKDDFLAPLDSAIKGSKFVNKLLSDEYIYPIAQSNSEEWIQRYFNWYILKAINSLYLFTCGKDHAFGGPLTVKPSFTNEKHLRFKPDIIHYLTNKLASLHEFPHIYFGLGDYKPESYCLSQGFEGLKTAIKDYKQKLTNIRPLRAMKASLFFEDKVKNKSRRQEWTPRVVFSLVLRKYFYQAFLCGTDRVLISDHQTFSGFFKYKIIRDDEVGDKMVIDYYVINDPETIADGITLRSAIAGFFYNSEEDALKTMESLKEVYKLRCIEQGSVWKEKDDPLRNVVPEPAEKSKSGPTSGKTSEKSHGNQLKGKLKLIEEDDDYDNFDEIRGNTYCQIVYDPVKAFPRIGLALPSPVFVKLYNYPEMAREHFPRRQSYYNMFITEFEINEMLAKSQFASHYAKLIMSGYWNGLPSHPMHMFEYLGKETPIDEWDEKVYFGIKSRLGEIHLMEISHNDIRSDNIHVSATGKITLIDFGLAIYPCSEENKSCDIEALDRLFSDYSNDNQSQNSPDNDYWNDDANSTHEAVFDELITGSDDTPETTKLDFNQKTDNDTRR
ncbi:unnamed protein product [Debaryomyces tyrocola]|nr:unnamed protein product [Debaryomyces tyrocola]